MGHYSNECKEPKAALRDKKEAQPAEKKRPASVKELAAVKEAMRRKYEANIGMLDRKLKAARDSKSLDALLAQFGGDVNYAAHVSKTVLLGQEQHSLQEALAAARETRAVTIKGGAGAPRLKADVATGRWHAAGPVCGHVDRHRCQGRRHDDRQAR
jgi:hypothetical protein